VSAARRTSARPESLPVSFTGEPLEIGFNADSSATDESVAGDEPVRFRLISPLRPCVLQADGATTSCT